MINIKDIDSNFKLDTFKIDDLQQFSCFENPIEINGLYDSKKLKMFTRMPEKYKTMEEINNGTRSLIGNTAGGRIRFATNSPYISVAIELSDIVRIPHMSLLGSSGADVYICERGNDDFQYRKSVIPEKLEDDEDRFYKTIIKFESYDNFKEHEVMIHLPLYNGVNNVYIGIKNGYELYAPVKYKYDKPIYFYGASITHGGCASRPGNNYPNHLSRWLKSDFVNLGFSGSAKGEPEIAKYLAKCDASALLIDLEMSANSIEIFSNTHYRFYECLRKYNKNIPIIFTSFPKYPKIHHDEKSGYRDHIISNRIILKTCQKAWENNDENVYYIDGESLFGTEDQDSCTVDFCHPNDLGFYKMAKGIYPVLKKALKV